MNPTDAPAVMSAVDSNLVGVDSQWMDYSRITIDG
jgi:hypothetical protein